MKQLSALGEGDVLFLAGSIPSSMADDAYQKIMEMLDGKGVRIVVDATRDLLMKVLPYHPFLIKPNNHELGEIFSVELKTRESVVPYAKQLQEKGAQNVLVSMAGEGAVLVAASGEVFEAPAERKAHQRRRRRRLDGSRIHGRLHGKRRLPPCVPYGNRSGKCKCFF